MTRRLTRREALAAAAATGTVVGGGCLGGGRERFWDDPPAFDAAGVSRALDDPVPDRPRLLPVGFEPDVEAAFVDRVGRLLDPVPDPVTAETLPNGAVRERIASERDAAREALSGGPDGDARVPLRRADRLAEARGHAAAAAGTWAAVTTAGDPGDVTAGAGAVRARAADTLEALPGGAAGPLAGAAAYGPIERRLDAALRRTLLGGDRGVAGRANPLRVGEAAGDVERVHSRVEAGRYLRDRYRNSLADPLSVDAPLREAAERVGSEVGERLRELHGDDAEDLRSNPGAEAFLAERPVPRDAPSASLLSTALSRTVEDLWFDPVPIGDREPDDPATALTRSVLARVRLRALDAVAAEVEDGATMFPADVAAVESARDAAIGRAASLAASDRALDRWLAVRVRPLFAKPDGVLAASDPSVGPVAEAYGEYRWIERVADEGEAVAASVAATVES